MMLTRKQMEEKLARAFSPELMRLPHDGYRYELVGGELRMTPVGGEHGDVAGVMAYFLIHHVRPRRLGKVVVASFALRVAELFA